MGLAVFITHDLADFLFAVSLSLTLLLSSAASDQKEKKANVW
jgi:hypothetical protein